MLILKNRESVAELNAAHCQLVPGNRNNKLQFTKSSTIYILYIFYSRYNKINLMLRHSPFISCFFFKSHQSYPTVAMVRPTTIQHQQPFWRNDLSVCELVSMTLQLPRILLATLCKNTIYLFIF